MSKYYKAEDVQELITACIWRMTLAKERNGEGFVEYDKQIIDVGELEKRLSYLPTIEVSEDCIDRAEALKAYNDAIEELVEAEMEEFNLGDFTECSFNTTQLKLIARKIWDAPSVIPQPKEGEWIEDALGTVVCSECKRPRRDIRINHTKFCNSCGAKMKG